MSLVLETMRQQCAQRIYFDTIGAAAETTWWNLDPKVREGFTKMVSAVFDELFKLNTPALIEFFTDGNVEDWMAANGYKKIN